MPVSFSSDTKITPLGRIGLLAQRDDVFVRLRSVFAVRQCAEAIAAKMAGRAHSWMAIALGRTVGSLRAMRRRRGFGYSRPRPAFGLTLDLKHALLSADLFIRVKEFAPKAKRPANIELSETVNMIYDDAWTQTPKERTSGFRFNHVVIVQSLESHETQTGKQMADFIDVEMQSLGLPLSVELVDCENYADFLRLVSQLEADGRRGMRPIVQIECHGDQNDGLEFANGSTQSWAELSAALSRVNIATRFNLVAIVSACFGAYFSSHMAPVEPAPCYAMISPTAEIKPYELRSGLQGFYREFLRSPDVGEAIRQLLQQRLSAGIWFAAAAEQWFVQTLVQYIDERCSRRASVERAVQLNDRWRAVESPEMSQRQVFKMLRERHKGIVEEAFATFFSLSLVPENASRFADCYASAKLKVDRIRARGTHIL